MQMYQVALAEAALVKLQLQSLDTKLLNISEEEVRKMLMYMVHYHKKSLKIFMLKKNSRILSLQQ
jgi:hypothetical protein